jgi:N-formylglutamate amidohydrolase
MAEPITREPAFKFHQGTRPLLLSMPHAGTYVPPAIAARLTDEARHVPDTDWHLPLLYDFAVELGASVLVATHSRYVVDVNRPPDSARSTALIRRRFTGTAKGPTMRKSLRGATLSGNPITSNSNRSWRA